MIHLRGITWAMRRGLAPLQAAAAAFSESRPDVRISWDALPWREMLRRQRETLSAGNGYDLVMLDQPWVGDYIENGWLVAVDEFMSTAELDALETAVDKPSVDAYRHRGKLCALPVDVACQTLTYRPDLVASPVSDDWEGILQLASERHMPPQRFGFVHTLRGTGGFLFVLSVAAAYGQDAYREPHTKLDREVGRLALQLLKDVDRLSLPNATLGDRRPFDYMRGNDAVGLWPAAFPYLESYSDGQAPALGLTCMPKVSISGRRTTALGGVGLGIANASTHRDVAWEFVRWAMSDEVQGGCWIRNGGQPGLRAALDGELMEERSPGLGRALSLALTDCYVRPHWAGWTWAEVNAGALIAAFIDARASMDDTLLGLDRIVDLAPRYASAVDLGSLTYA